MVKSQDLNNQSENISAEQKPICLAPHILERSVRYRVKDTLKLIKERIRQRQLEEARGVNFKEYYPLYYEMLSKYSDCKFIQKYESDIHKSPVTSENYDSDETE